MDDPDYNFDEDLADRAIEWIQMQKAVAPKKPFFAYYATGTAHAPHHAPKEWIEKFKGDFDHGWDRQREITFAQQKEMGIIPASTKLTVRSPGIEAWDPLSDDEKKVVARMMEVYAAALSHADHQLGRVIDAVEALGVLDNTLIIYIRSNASMFRTARAISAGSISSLTMTAWSASLKARLPISRTSRSVSAQSSRFLKGVPKESS